MSKEGYVPLSEVYSDRIKSQLTLPFHLEEQIGLNVRKTERLAQLGGIRSITLKNDDEGKTSKIERVIVGMNGDGSAMAGAAKTSYVPTSEMEMRSDKSKTHSARWADVSVTINSEEIKQRLLNGNKVVSKSPSWVHEIDTAIKKEIQRAGNTQLLVTTPRDKFDMFFVYGLNATFILGSVRANPTVEAIALELLGRYLHIGLVWNVLDKFLYDSENYGFGTRTTFGVGPELDRAAIFNLSFLGKPLVTNLK